MEEENSDVLRFRAHKSGNNITFFGYLTDTIWVGMLDGILVDNAVCDFSNVKFGSWIGLNLFQNYVKEKKFTLVYENLSDKLFEVLKLIENIQEYITFSSFHIQGSEELIKVTSETLKLLPQDQEFIEIEGKKALLLRRYFDQQLFGKNLTIQFPRKIDPISPEEAQFFLSYIYFSKSTFDMADVLTRSAEINILQIMDQLHDKIMAGEQFLKLLHPEYTHELSLKIEKALLHTKSVCELLIFEIEAFLGKTNVNLVSCMDIFLKDMDHNAFYDCLLQRFSMIKNLYNLSQKFEKGGPDIGNHLAHMQVEKVIRDALDPLEEVSEDMMTSIRDCFLIMDILTEGNWPETKVQVYEEIAQIEALINKMIITLQSFDLIRQLLEHRQKESLLMLEEIPKLKNRTDANGWMQLKEKVFEKISAHLVTDQEKNAYRFYLPEGFEKNKKVERHEPGEVLLF